MSTLRAFALGVSVAILASCGGDPEPASRLISFRTVAMRATRVVQSDTCDAGLVSVAEARPGMPPKLGKTKCDVSGSYVHPGDEVQIELLWHDPDPTGKRSYLWTTCMNPQSTSVLGCFQKLAQDIGKLQPDQRAQFFINTVRQRPLALSKAFEGNELAADPASDPRTVFRIKVPDTALKELDGRPPAAKIGASIGVIFMACPGTLRVTAEPLAAALDPGVQCLDEAGEPVGSDRFTIGIKRLFLRATDENADPRINAVLLDGQPWDPAEEKVIRATCGEGESRFERCGDPKREITLQLAQPVSEKGTDEFGKAFDEQVVVQYYSTEGLFEFDLKRAEDPKTRFSGRKPSGAQGDRMWIVIRDNRGGVSWVERKFRVVAP